MLPEQIKEKYEPRILKILQEMREAIDDDEDDDGDKRFACGYPFDMHDEQYSWWLPVYHANGDPDEEDDPICDIRFEILQSEVCDGEENGVNFGVSVTAHGGHPCGGAVPYNYTDRVWVDRDDEDAVEERFQLLERCDQGSIIDCVETALDKE